MSEIKISYEMTDIEALTIDQKLDILLKIGFANRELLEKHSKVLYGNGESGICDMTRSHAHALKAVWTILLLIIAGMVGMVFR